MTAAARASQDTTDTTVDEPNRIELLETANRVHWVVAHEADAVGIAVPFLACGTDTLWDRRSFGSAAALTCGNCVKAFARQQQQQAVAATVGRGEQG